MNRRPLIVGNWKMNKTLAETRALLGELCAAELPKGVEVVVAPPFTALDVAREALRASQIGLGAQNMHHADYGAFTGEISPVMLRELGVRFVILGHSERRTLFGETDDAVRLKVRAALAHSLTPIVAVGESAEEHERNETLGKVTRQATTAFAGLDAGEVAKCLIAYEPIWAIGTGKNDEPSDANAVIAELRRAVDGLQDARMLYGGSMKPENAAALLAQPNVDGGLVGGASLSARGFLAIVEAAALRAETR